MRNLVATFLRRLRQVPFRDHRPSAGLEMSPAGEIYHSGLRAALIAIDGISNPALAL
jgi:hypothetical protein